MTHLPVGSHVTIADIVEKQRLRLEGLADVAKPISVSEEGLSVGRATVFRYVRSGEKAGRNAIYIFSRGEDGYALRLAVRPEDYDDMRLLFAAILSSLSW